MLNLVHYGSSDEEDTETADKNVTDFNLNDNSEGTPSSSGTLFKKLPQPTCSNDTLKQVVVTECELEAEVIRKRDWLVDKKNNIPAAKKPKKVKIFLPDISEFGDEGSDNDDGLYNAANLRSVKAESTKGSALLSLLPQPSTSCSATKASPLFVPREQALKKAPSGSLKSATFAPRSVEQKSEAKIPAVTDVPAKNLAKLVALADYGSDQSCDSDDEHNFSSVARKPDSAAARDFFGLTSTSGPLFSASVDLEEACVVSSDNTNDFITTTTNTSATLDHGNAAEAVHPSQMYNLASGSDMAHAYETNDDFDYAKRVIYENEIEKLHDGHNYVLPDDLEIHDVQVDSHLGQVRENLLKNITSSKAPDAMLVAAQMAAATGGGGKSSKKAKPDPTAKRKHQITYLAHLAKEREEALQNQWAQNKQKRRDAQSKYGFR